MARQEPPIFFRGKRDVLPSFLIAWNDGCIFELVGKAVGIREAKLMVRRILDGQAEDSAETSALFAQAFTLPDFAEGVTAFMDKRKPCF